ncbi:non-specific lipid transfer protein GPI-anchored 14-like [Silene latifolia]|uniref:non-specific lipid transfer protein GPI-anchored 14-like n=1 Tax=Silene latifolia TaxID=37657 RepID=UPI003D77813B
MRRYGSIVVLLIIIVNIANGDINEDKKECADALIDSVSTCLIYTGGQGKAPSPDCCTGVNHLLKTHKKCLCILIKDKDDPSLGLNVNGTLALGLPDKCNSPDKDVAACADLLHLEPNSPEAKVFTDFGKGAAPATPSTPKVSDSTTSTQIVNSPTNGSNGNKWSSIQVFYGVLLWCFTFYFVY